jgi:hypothetical protein
MLTNNGVWYRKVRRRKDGQPCKENLWHTFLMTTYSDHAVIWWQECEEQTALYNGDIREYKAACPMPQLKDFMIRLAKEWTHAPDSHSLVA